MTATAVQTSAVPPRRGTDHLIQLDGLRAVAIGLVLAQHLLPLHRLMPNPGGLPPHKLVPPLGFYGVCLFFVLSGFLITRILLAARDRVALGESGVGRQMGVFYARRTLRIFPLYYGTLLALALLDVRHIRERLPWHLTYTGNWLFSMPAAYNAGGFERHFWSLGVEEQFYLVWPWLILLTPRRLLLPVMALALASGPVWRAWFALRGWPWQWTQFPTPANLDLLAMGGIVALAWPHLAARRWLVWSCLVVGLPTALVHHRPVPQRLPADAAANLPADGAGVVLRGVRWLLRARPAGPRRRTAGASAGVVRRQGQLRPVRLPQLRPARCYAGPSATASARRRLGRSASPALP